MLALAAIPADIPWVSYIKERKRVRLTPSWDFASTLPSPSETAAADAYRALGALIVARAAPGIIAAEFLVGGRYLHDYQSCTGLSPSEAAAEIGHAIPAHWRP